jgi:hypothetical protein
MICAESSSADDRYPAGLCPSFHGTLNSFMGANEVGFGPYPELMEAR